MTREEFIELLKDYKENKAKRKIKLKELQNARENLKECIDYDTSVTSKFGVNQDIQSKNQVNDKVYNKVESNDIKAENIRKHIEKLEEIIRDLTNKVDTVDDRLSALKYKESEIIRSYYIEGLSAEYIGNNLYWNMFKQTRSERHVQRVIDRAVEKMLKL